MKLLIDTNILLDAVLAREPFATDAKQILEWVDAGWIVGCVTATTLTDLFYIVRRQTKHIQLAKQAVETVLATLQVLPVNRDVVERALALDIEDLEDGIQAACAIGNQVDAIATRDIQGFKAVDIPVLTVSELQIQILREHPELEPDS